MLTTIAHLKDTPNIGDQVCAPYHYFDFPELKIKDLRDKSENLNPKVAIFGGGAIEPYIKGEDSSIINYKSSNKVLWGIGSSRSGMKKNPPFISDEFSLIGLREWGREGGEYLPCVSCMSPFFDKYKESRIEREVGVYAHAVKSADFLTSFDGFDIINNRVDFEQAIRFIASSEIVVTNSFHGTYWALLLSKKVICIPFSSKFYGYKFEPNYTSLVDWKKQLNAKFSLSEDYLQESRKINIDFYKKVMNLY